jgi:hypothetical protein
MMHIAYFDCFSGASGDMLLGALLDAGLPFDGLQEDIARLNLGEVKLTCARQVRRGISGSKFDVVDEGHDRPARNLAAVKAVFDASDLPEQVLARSLHVFEHLAEAEAHVHGTTVDAVHFHEVGAIDSLVDIVGFCAGIQRLGIEALYASPLPTGSGVIRTEHGLLPVPAPATLALLASVQAPLVPFDACGELVTPTGAALLVTLATFAQPAMRVSAVGYGFGAKEFPWANALRVWIGEEIPQPQRPHASHTRGTTQSHELRHAHTHGEAHDHGPEHSHPHAGGRDHEQPHLHDAEIGHSHPHD